MPLGFERQAMRDRMAALYSRFINPSDLVFDIGANRGDWTEVFLALGARVVALEPQPSCFSQLRARYLGRSDVLTLSEAAGDSEGPGTLTLSDNDLVSSMSAEWIERARASGRFDDSHWGPEVAVKVTTLDRLIDNYGLPAFIKIDVEGYEDRVLDGLSVEVDALSFEYTPEHLAPAARSVEKLERLGEYSFNYSEGSEFTLALGEEVNGDTLLHVLDSLASRGKEAVSGDVYAWIPF